eukprot:TRINITY_DN77827_c0_g1_i1.p1 TRINITY_DN77827_c0_g1~~TRINITY_DN77827_c0_g1_i1.p1  ORF type:complete len:161 (-),score=20.50 TRINITY_DN77827_c0_g1_i1:60-542(-)
MFLELVLFLCLAGSLQAEDYTDEQQWMLGDLRNIGATKPRCVCWSKNCRHAGTTGCVVDVGDCNSGSCQFPRVCGCLSRKMKLSKTGIKTYDCHPLIVDFGYLPSCAGSSPGKRLEEGELMEEEDRMWVDTADRDPVIEDPAERAAAEAEFFAQFEQPDN